MKLDSLLSDLAGLGPKTIEKLRRLGLYTARDLLFYFPRRYEDYTNITNIGDLGNPESEFLISNQTPNPNIYTIKGTILGITNKKTRRRGFTVTEAQVVDDTGTIKVVWFNQPWLEKYLRAGSNVILNGKVTPDYYRNPSTSFGTGGLVMESPTRANRPMIVPVYGETEGVTSFFIAKIFSKLKHLISDVEEHLPTEFISSKFEVRSSKQGVILSEAKNLPVLPKTSLGDPSALPQDDKSGLLPIQDAILNIHEPKNSAMLAAAQRRMAFDELFLISLQSQMVKTDLNRQKTLKLKTPLAELKKFVAGLPWELTGDQKKAIWQIAKDLEGTRPMNRLLSGDVGSGKTVVAAAAAFITVQNGPSVGVAGKKAVLMVPTSILANQHFETFCKLFRNYDIEIGLITSERKEVFPSVIPAQAGIPDSPHGSPDTTLKNTAGPEDDKKRQFNNSTIQQCDIIIGTQALIQPDIKIENLALTIVDEQHRFGVRQREALQYITGRDKIQETITKRGEVRPHFLSMTATPIPRTMYLSLFGDLDVSFLIEKPANRKLVKTRIVDEFNRDKAYRFIRELIKRGRQVFVVCPLIEDKTMSKSEFQISNEMSNDKFSNVQLFEEERKTVMAEAEKLKTIFPEFKIVTLHGRMKAKDKDAIMADFVANKANILVSTSVVEVGVDVPNAAVMVIEDAERFGLATIHQFRGRVGRAEHQSFCFLFSNSQSEKAITRLKSLEKISDGYKLAEIDLETRGFGSILGTEQSGILDLKMASFSDKILMEEAGAAAKNIVAKIDKYPKLKEKVDGLSGSKHLE